MLEPSTSQTLVIRGVKVYFPVKPYPSQMAMMGQIVKGLKRRENCLLESPTGTGKSLALLCATLAWQAAEEDCVFRYNRLIDQGITDPDILNNIFVSSSTTTQPPSADHEVREQLPNHHSTNPPPANLPTHAVHADHGPITDTQEGGFVRDDAATDPVLDDFRMPSVRFRRVANEGEENSNSILVLDETLNDDGQYATSMNPAVAQGAIAPTKKRTPQIYFGTRTHKQVFQIIRELQRTQYRNVRSVVLGSREHTCIHPEVSVSNNKNEGCATLLDRKNEEFCSFYTGAIRITDHSRLASHGLKSAWDLEDLVKVGKKMKACPYYITRQLIESSQIVFCPYNYLIDPLIRANMNINLQNCVVVLDEAHNIEDCSREASSASLTQEDMLEAKSDLEKLLYFGANPDSCHPLISMLANLIQWMEANKENLTDYSEFGRSGKIFSGAEIVNHLSALDIDPKSMVRLEKCLKNFSDDAAQSEGETETPRLLAATTQMLSSFFLILKFLFLSDMKNVDDYKVALVRTQTFSKRSVKKGWRQPSSGFVYSLNFWCLNPGVAFNELGVITRSIILTSGTLSPMNSFASELQVKFPVRLEANHVINQDQVWVATIARGPTNHSLNATFKNTETLAFQDELGRMILGVCKAIPKGVLCFLPSYAMQSKLTERWQSSPIWTQIEEKKKIFIEPRRSEEFEALMKDFYKTIEDTKVCPVEGKQNGALFIAVCRGKVSEGLDFTDDNARAVIAVGIPYPNVKDIKVNLKRQYNDAYSRTRGLLSSKQWYDIQAYRALNQALGRCIRHRHDWGAILLVDERYQINTSIDNHYVKGLSRWVRNSLCHQPSFKDAAYQLKLFAEKMTQNPPLKECEILELRSCTSMTDTVMPKFASPPIFESHIKKELNREKSQILGHQNTTCLRLTDDEQQLPLTPILNDASVILDFAPAGEKGPLTSTQKPSGAISSSDPVYELPRFSIDTNVNDNPSTTLSTASNTSKFYPIFETIKPKFIQKRSDVRKNNSNQELSKHSISPLPIHFDKPKHQENPEIHCLDDDESCLSDDMFAQQDEDSMMHPVVEVELSRGKKQKKDNKIRTPKQFDPNVTRSRPNPSPSFDKLSITPIHDNYDSDLDDFNLNSSFAVRSSQKNPSNAKRKRLEKKKGIKFCDYN